MEWAGAWQIGNVTATFLSAPLDPFCARVCACEPTYTCACTHAPQTRVVLPGSVRPSRTHICGCTFFLFTGRTPNVFTPIVAIKNHKFTSGRREEIKGGKKKKKNKEKEKKKKGTHAKRCVFCRIFTSSCYHSLSTTLAGEEINK